MKHTYVFDDGRPNVVHEVATMDDLRLVSAFEALQAQVDEHTRQIVAMHELLVKLDNLLTQDLDELRAQGKYS